MGLLVPAHPGELNSCQAAAAARILASHYGKLTSTKGGLRCQLPWGLWRRLQPCCRLLRRSWCSLLLGRACSGSCSSSWGYAQGLWLV